jgi:hypothetical protein
VGDARAPADSNNPRRGFVFWGRLRLLMERLLSHSAFPTAFDSYRLQFKGRFKGYVKF